VAKTRSATVRRSLQQVKRFEKQFKALRAKAGSLRRQELALLKGLATLMRAGKSPRLTTIEHRTSGRDKVTQQPIRGTTSPVAVARQRGGSGLFCECAPIRVIRQPNDDLDICILIDCSDSPETTGFRCSYYCMTLVAPPLVG